MTKRITIKRLTMLEHMLRNHDKIFPQTKFNIKTWCDRENSCNTAACALGSAALYKPFNKLGLYADMDHCMMPRYQGNSEYFAGASFFNISLAESEFLFSPDEYYRAQREISTIYGYFLTTQVTPKHVADRVAWLIANYKRRSP